MTAQLPPKPKIDIQEYLGKRALDAPPKPKLATKPALRPSPPPLPSRPPLPRRPEVVEARPPLPQRPSSSQCSRSRTNSAASTDSWMVPPAASPEKIPPHRSYSQKSSPQKLSPQRTARHHTPTGSTCSTASLPLTPSTPYKKNYAPKPMHTSVPLETHQADNRPPAEIPTSFLNPRSRKILAANDHFILASTASKCQLYFWRTSSLAWQIKTIVWSAAYVAETETLWLGTASGKILITCVESGEILQTLDRGHSKAVTTIALSKIGILSYSADDGKLSIWSPHNTGTPAKVTRARAGVSGKGSVAVASGAGSYYMWLGKNRDIEVYRPGEQAIPIASTTLPTRGTNLGTITSAAASGEFAFFGLNDGFIAVFREAEQLGVINGGIHSITALAALSSTELWAGTRSGEILVYTLQTSSLEDAQEGAPLCASLRRQWRAHTAAITQIVLAENKSAMLTVDRTSIIHVWNSTPTDILPPLPSSRQCLNVQVLTWNIGASSPKAVKPDWLFTEHTRNADILLIGLQEVVELENTSQHALNIVRPADQDQDKAHLKWQQFLESLMTPCGFTLVISKSMVGIMTCLFVKHKKASFMSNVRADVVKTGIGGAYGNKGGVVISCNLANMSWCFANCHLAAGHTAIIQRNRDASQIMSYERLQSDVCFFFGDTNYRINAAREQAEQLIKHRSWPSLQKHDQLTSQISKIPSFCLGRFQEGPLNFPPTYKYDRGSSSYDTSDKKRIPSWCDRILFRGNSVTVKEYSAVSSTSCSDHKAVVGTFTVPLLT